MMGDSKISICATKLSRDTLNIYINTFFHEYCEIGALDRK